VRTIRLDDAASRTDDRHLHPIEVPPTRVPAQSRWFAPAVGVMVAIVSFGFGGSLASRPSAEDAPRRTRVAADVHAIDYSGPSFTSIVVRESRLEGILRLRVSIVPEPPALLVDASSAGVVSALLIRVSDRAGRLMATSTAAAHPLPSVLGSDPTGLGMSAISAMLPLPGGSAIDEVLVDIVAVQAPSRS
jgi:hypothetical protein